MGSTPDRNARLRATAFASTILGGLEDTVAADPGSAGQGSLTTSGALAGADRYQLGEVLGEGGMGSVFEATDRSFGRRVAWKQLRHGTRSAALVRRFVVEATVTANLEHPGIVPVHERGVRDGKPYYVMRRLDGRTLADALDAAKGARGRLELVPVLARVAHTLAYAHERGVIHRDIKPDNVIVGEHGEVTVIDWGIARVRELERIAPELSTATEPSTLGDDANRTAAGSILGTPAYMAPEQALGEREAIDERTDVFALGALLYHVLAGRAPYEGPSIAEVISKASQGNPPPLAAVAPDAPPPLVAICERAMQRAPSARYATASDVADALEGALTQSLTARPERWIVAMNAAATVLLVAFTALMAAVVQTTLPSLREIGTPAYPPLVLGVVGLALAVTEGVTRGRHRLAKRVRLLAVTVFGLGLAGTLANGSRVLARLSDESLATDGAKWRETFAQGAYEALGGVTAGTMLALAVAIAAELASLRSKKSQ